MEDKHLYYRRQIIHLRKKLADLEARRAQYELDVPTEIWQELAEVAHLLEQAEQDVRRYCGQLAGDVNQARTEIVAMLELYHLLTAQMRRVEDLFVANIVRPGYHLKQAIRQREYLAREYQRIQAGIQSEAYASQQALESDIRRALTHGDTAFEARPEDLEEELGSDEESAERLDHIVDEIVEAVSREELIKEFKRVVLPAVHPDTSTTPAETFKTVFEVYKRGDYLLMEAYIAQYRGELQPEPDADPLEHLDLLLIMLERYQRLLGRLERRVDRIKQDLTAQELEDPVKIQENMQRQRQEILHRIQSEAEQILYWREKLEKLVQDYQDAMDRQE